MDQSTPIDISPAVPSEGDEPPPMRRRRTPVTILVVLVLVAAVGAVLVARQSGDDAAASAASAATGTAKVTRRDLAVTEDVKGDLGYAGERDLTSHRGGVVTWLPPEAAVLKQGGTLFGVDLEPTVLLTGRVPAYRALSTRSADGADITQLEKALVALGHGDGLTVDDHFSAATADAVEAWESDLKRADPDGTVELGDVVFAPGPVRVAGLAASVGAPVQDNGPVLTISTTEKVVDVDLEVDKSDLVTPGDTVAVRLPDDRETAGKVASVGTEAKTDATDPNADPTVKMVVTLTEPGDAAHFDSGSATVTIEQSRDDDVLAVPVTALLALAEGGYAIQVVDPTRPSGYRLVGVQTGTITEDYAGISGTGVGEGIEVVVPR